MNGRSDDPGAATARPDRGAGFDVGIADVVAGAGLTHASFFSGVGGTDIGLERAGWRTVSFSEIEPYACTVLGERWPDVPNLGSIVDLATAARGDGVRLGYTANDRRPAASQPRLGDVQHDGLPGRPADDVRLAEPESDGAGEQRRAGRAVPDEAGTGGQGRRRAGDKRRVRRGVEERQRADDGPGGSDGDVLVQGPEIRREGGDAGDSRGPVGLPAGDDWTRATLWSGGFPCQDLSVAGKRRGMGVTDGAVTRSGLAFAFLDLVERYRPPAILLENVPGLLSSHHGRDLYALLRRLGELGYGWAFRVLDAQHVGVPQRRRRVFILGLRSDPDDAGGRIAAERAAQVLSVGARCRRHPTTGQEAGEGATADAAPGAVGPSEPDYAPALTRGVGRFSGGYSGIDDAITRTASALLGASAAADADRVREADGLAGRLDDIHGLENAQEIALDDLASPVREKEDWPRGDGDDTLVVARSKPEARDTVANTVDTSGRWNRGDGTDNLIGSLTADGIDKNASQNAMAGHYIPVSLGGAKTQDTIRTADGVAQPVTNWTPGKVVQPVPISGDALRGEGIAQTPSADAEGVVRLRDPGFGVGDEGDPAFTVNATSPGAVAIAGDLAPSLQAGRGSERLDVDSAEALQPTTSPPVDDDYLLPDGLDSHRYRCCGNGVVAPVAYWIGHRLAQEFGQ